MRYSIQDVGKIVIGGKWLNLRHEPAALLCRFDWLHLGIVHTRYALCARFAQSLPRISELNLPRIAAQSILGLNRLRLSIVYISISSAFGLHDFPLLHRAVKLTRTKWSCYFPQKIAVVSSNHSNKSGWL